MADRRAGDPDRERSEIHRLQHVLKREQQARLSLSLFSFLSLPLSLVLTVHQHARREVKKDAQYMAHMRHQDAQQGRRERHAKIKDWVGFLQTAAQDANATNKAARSKKKK
jgi:hypothetical protein